MARALRAYLRGQRLDLPVLRDATGCIQLALTSPGPSVDPDALADFYSVRDQRLADLGPGPVSVANEAL